MSDVLRRSGSHFIAFCFCSDTARRVVMASMFFIKFFLVAFIVILLLVTESSCKIFVFFFRLKNRHQNE